MDPTIVEEVYETAEAASAAGVDLWPLRTWLKFRKLEPFADLDAGRPIGSTKHQFSALDVLRVALVGVLVRYGFTVAEADSIVRRHVLARWRTMADLSTPKPAPLPTVPVTLPALAAESRGLVMRVSRTSTGTVATVEPAYLPGVPGWRPDTARRTHEITIDLGAVASQVAERLLRRAVAA